MLWNPGLLLFLSVALLLPSATWDSAVIEIGLPHDLGRFLWYFLVNVGPSESPELPLPPECWNLSSTLLTWSHTPEGRLASVSWISCSSSGYWVPAGADTSDLLQCARASDEQIWTFLSVLGFLPLEWVLVVQLCPLPWVGSHPLIRGEPCKICRSCWEAWDILRSCITPDQRALSGAGVPPRA